MLDLLDKLDELLRNFPSRPLGFLLRGIVFPFGRRHTGPSDALDAEVAAVSGRAKGDPTGLIYAGAAIADPALFEAVATEPHSLNAYFDRAIAAGRLFGLVMQGHWITVGTPDAIAPAEAAVARAFAEAPRVDVSRADTR